MSYRAGFHYCHVMGAFVQEGFPPLFPWCASTGAGAEISPCVFWMNCLLENLKKMLLVAAIP